MKKVLLLGSSGFTGHNMLEYFSNQYEVGHPGRGELDVLDEEKVAACLKEGKYDVVLNCLDWRSLDGTYFEGKLRMFCNLAKYSDQYGKMIYFGSGAEYARELPVEQIGEEKFGRKLPADMYGFCMYQIAQAAMRSENIYCLRLFGIFGRYETWRRRFISNAICKAMYGYPVTIRRDCYFDYLYVDDLCRIVHWFMENTPRYHDYNATSGRRYSLKELAEMVIAESGKDLPIFVAEDGLAPEYSGSNRRLCAEMQFTPTDMRQSIREMTAFYHGIQGEIDRYPLLYQG